MKELKLIEHIRKTAAKSRNGAVVGIGDDCAVLEHTKDKYLLWASDMIVEGTHFDIKKAGYEKIGRKAVAVNVSDIAAMGGVPKHILVSLGIPKKTGIPEIKRIYRGINKMCARYGIGLIGGDTDRSKVLTLDVSIIGEVEKKRLVRRSGAKKGDIILVTGPVRDGRKSHLDFEPRLNEARYLTEKYKVNSMIDTSDGIAPDVGRICSESRTGCRLYVDSVPLVKGLRREDALYYGESFELLFTMSPRYAQKLLLRKGTKKGFYAIGEVTDRRGGMKLVRDNGKANPLKMLGYCHL